MPMLHFFNHSTLHSVFSGKGDRSAVDDLRTRSPSRSVKNPARMNARILLREE